MYTMLLERDREWYSYRKIERDSDNKTSVCKFLIGKMPMKPLPNKKDKKESQLEKCIP